MKKKCGETSFDVVERIKLIVKEKKVGHTGTLDKPASGVLVVLVGKATKLAEFFLEDEKEYLAKVKLGRSTDTDDSTGETLDTGSVNGLDEDSIRRAVLSFKGEMEQVPPVYSRVRLMGVRSDTLARSGIRVNPRPRRVTVDELEVLGIEGDEIRIRVVCSRGTYIRALARDIGKKLGCMGHLGELVRSRVGDNRLENSIDIDEVSGIEEHVVSMKDALGKYPILTIDPGDVVRVVAGQSLSSPSDACYARGGIVRICDAKGSLVAVCKAEENLLRPLRVLAR